MNRVLKVTGLARSTYYYGCQHLDDIDQQDDPDLLTLIHQIHTQEPKYGAERITDELHNRGHIINHKRILRITRENGWQVLNYHKSTHQYHSYVGEVGSIAPNRLHQHFITDRPLQKLVTDVTDIRWGNQTLKERLFLSPVMDLYNDEILDFNISSHPTVDFVLDPVKRVLNNLPNLPYRTTMHSDRGVQYQHSKWRKELRRHRVFQSMSRLATCLDNAQMESFFSVLKAELDTKNYKTKEALIKAIKAWINHYNTVRIKHHLGGKSPVDFRKSAAKNRPELV